MNPTRTSPRYREILLSVGPHPGRRDERRRLYEALVYSNVEELRGSVTPSEDRPPVVGGLPLVGIETIAIKWQRYHEYVELFMRAEKEPHLMRQRLFEAMPGRLETILDTRFSGKPVRLWWHLRAPELDELPWELLASGRSGGVRMSVVRGLPGEMPPLVPLDGPLRLGVIGAGAASSEMQSIWTAPRSGLVGKLIAGGLRQGLQDAVARGLELVHLVVDGSVSAGFDPILELHGETMATSELHAVLDGSRVTILALTPTERADHDVEHARATYTAFSHLGGGTSNTSLVATVGPIATWRRAAFWSAFYQKMAEKLSVEKALWAAHREYAQAAPVAVFLRHRLGVEFARRTEPVHQMAGPQIDPVRLDAEVRADREFLEAISQIQEHYPESASAEQSVRLHRERARLESAEQTLEPYRDVEEADADE